MAHSETKKTKKKKKKLLTKQNLVRVFVLFLAVLMIAGTLYSALYFLLIDARAEGSELPDFDPDKPLRVGLSYGDNVTVGFAVSSKTGMCFGTLDSLDQFHEIQQVTDTLVSVTCDCNLKNESGTFSKSTEGNTNVGGYHIQFPVDPETGAPLHAVSNYEEVFEQVSLSWFPAVINGERVIRVGQFSTAEKASAYYQYFCTLILDGTIVGPSDTGLSVVNPATNRILFEYDQTDGTEHFGIIPAPSNDGSRGFLVTPAKNQYEGIFMFQRNMGSSLDGVELINVMTLEEYIEGVLPYEIGVSWPSEAMKAFSITVRSYVASQLGRHQKYGFDLCNTICCQTYHGCGRTNDAVREAVAATKGKLLLYNGKICSTFYSSSAGGTTVSAADAWGSSVESNPYLVAIATPWEKYTDSDHMYGSWTLVRTPEEMAQIMQDSGYTELQDAIASIQIQSLAKNSSYVNSVTVTDIHGNSRTIKRSDSIRIGLYLYSANFVVAKAGEKVTITDYSLDGFLTGDAFRASSEKPENAEEPKMLNVLTSDGVKQIPQFSELTVLTGSGLQTFTFPNETVSEPIPEIPVDPSWTILPNPMISVGEDAAGLPDLSSMRLVKTTREVTAEGPEGSFVFIGRGWGHGVGISQWGVKDLSDLGYGSEAILRTYCPGAVVVDYTAMTEADAAE